MRAPSPVPPDIHQFEGSGMVLAGVRRATFRRNGVTVVFSERDDGWWRITRLDGGKILSEKILRDLPNHQAEIVRAAVKGRYRPVTTEPSVRSS